MGVQYIVGSGSVKKTVPTDQEGSPPIAETKGQKVLSLEQSSEQILGCWKLPIVHSTGNMDTLG